MIKKLKDITIEEYIDWKEKNCSRHDKCDTCPFKLANCYSNDKNSWVNNKDSFSDKFLNQEVEIELDILTDKEKQYLRNVIKPFRNSVKNISKQKIYSKYEYISICFSVPLDISYYCSTNYIYLPFFIKGTIYKNMEVGREYTLKELEL